MGKYETNNHSVFGLRYHLILVTKYRRKALDDEIIERAKKIFSRVSPTYNITLIEANGEPDHIHYLFRAQPNSELSKFINAYKSASSRLLKKEYPRIKNQLWKEYLWSRSYFLATCGDTDEETIRLYIEMQGEKPDEAKPLYTQVRELNS